LGYPSFLLSYGTIGVSAGDGILLVTNSYPCFAEQYVTEENSRRKKIEKIVAVFLWERSYLFQPNADQQSRRLAGTGTQFDILSELSSEYRTRLSGEASFRQKVFEIEASPSC
jgi:hypothetical protein